jgi:cell division septum initiation protein DivIVA
MDDTVELLDRLSKSLKGMKGQAAEAQAEIARLNSQRDQIHGNILRQAQQDAAEARDNLLKAAKANAATTIADAREQADAILRDARTKAAQLVAAGEARIKGYEAALVLEKAKALLSERAAA